MAHPGSSPLPILLVLPPGPDGPVPHGLAGGGPLLADLLCAEVAACVAAVGHRLHTVPRSTRWTEHLASPEAGAPALVLWGLGPGEDAPMTGPGPGAPVVPVTLGPGPPPRGALGLPADSRLLCRALARAARHDGDPATSHRVAVLLHEGEGPDGDARWPGLGWALTLLWAGPGRGVLMDLRGPGGGLSTRLREFSPLAGDPLGWHSPGTAPVPGPALMARLPGAGGVRWWGWSDPPRGTGPRDIGPHGTGADRMLWADRDECIRTVCESAVWTVLDVGRDAGAARAAAQAGIPVIRCTGGRGDGDPGVRPDVVVRADGTDLGDGAVSFRAADWSGYSTASWLRSARGARGRRLAAEIALRLDRTAVARSGEAPA